MSRCGREGPRPPQDGAVLSGPKELYRPVSAIKRAFFQLRSDVDDFVHGRGTGSSICDRLRETWEHRLIPAALGGGLVVFCDVYGREGCSLFARVRGQVLSKALNGRVPGKENYWEHHLGVERVISARP